MAKRIVTRIGDVFCVEVDGKYKRFFQYICNDLSELNSSVIRVFESCYPIDYTPDIAEIISGKVAFYAHTVLRVGIEENLCYRVGKTTDIGEMEMRQILFGSTEDTAFSPNNEVISLQPLSNWYIWHINEEPVYIGKLPKKYHDVIELGDVWSFYQIYVRIKYGYYTYSDVAFDILKRKPLPYAESYTKVTDYRNETTEYFHFHGETAVRQIIEHPGKSIRLSEHNSSIGGYSLSKMKFWERNWLYEEFITEDEFDKEWNVSFIDNPEPPRLSAWEKMMRILRKYRN